MKVIVMRSFRMIFTIGISEVVECFLVTVRVFIRVCENARVRRDANGIKRDATIVNSAIKLRNYKTS